MNEWGFGYDGFVRKADFPFLADWFAITLRWMSLVGAALMVGVVCAPINLFSLCILGGLGLWNVFITILAANNRRLVAHRFVNVLVDFLGGAGLFIFNGNLSGPLIWIGILAILSSAVYFEWRGSLVTALIFSITQAGFAFITNGFSKIEQFLPIWGLTAGINLILGLVFGLLSLRMMKIVRKRYQEQLIIRTESERKAQLQERRRMQTFYEMTEALSATLNYQVVLNTALDLSANAMIGEQEDTRLISAVLLFGEKDLTIGSARGLSPTDLRQSFPADAGILAEAIKRGEPQHTTEPTHDPELSRLLSLQPCKSALALPLLRGLDAYGVLLFAHVEANFFHQERRELLEIISHQATTAIQNARLFQEIREEKEQIIASQEDARKKLARDLHDGPTQSVSSIAMRLSVARVMLERAPQDLPKELAEIEDLARKTTQEIRHMLFTLRPLVLEAEGLIPALQTMADKMRDTYHQNVLIEADPQVVELLETAKQSAVFSISEEAVNNARKHAEASQIRVSLKFITRDRSMALLEIADNGKGFDVQSIQSSYNRRGSLGMINLRERTELVSGALHIESQPGKGTRIQIVIPLTEEAADRLRRGLLAKGNPS